jgi:hypothetical protein
MSSKPNVFRRVVDLVVTGRERQAKRFVERYLRELGDGRTPRS